MVVIKQCYAFSVVYGQGEKYRMFEESCLWGTPNETRNGFI